MRLDALMNRHGTDKFWAHHYETEYARHFGPLRDRPVTLLEIGIGGYGDQARGGQSLKVWHDYGPQWMVHGLDVEDKSFLDGERIRTHVGNQRDAVLMAHLNFEFGPFDIIIDDGSHIQSDILASFHTLFPIMNSGGIYVIEDMETAYRSEYGGSPRPLTDGGTLSLLADLMDGLHHSFWFGRAPSQVQRLVESVHVSRELAFIYRQ